MSQKPSLAPPTSSPGAPLTFKASEKAVYEVGAIAASFGFFGMVWLNRELIVEDSFGWLVDFVERGKPISQSVLATVGLEGDIIALQARPDRVIELPAVAVAEKDRPSKKLNFTFFWNGARDCPMALAYRSPAQTELELELSRQIRARLMAEADANAKSKELARANADLESFAAVVSHDLKAPLRHMRYLAEDARRDLRPDEQEQLTSRLHQIGEQAERMSHMLTALFDYSSLGRKYDALTVVDTRALIDAICNSLPESAITIHITGEWPALTTLKAPLDLVLSNLVSNALLHHDRSEGMISIACKDDQSELVITVADDGPGIGAEHHDSIFLPFRTLQSDEKARSTGMGLAMVKKAVEGVGGSIAIASNPFSNRGTTFDIHWPKYIGVY